MQTNFELPALGNAPYLEDEALDVTVDMQVRSVGSCLSCQRCALKAEVKLDESLLLLSGRRSVLLGRPWSR